MVSFSWTPDDLEGLGMSRNVSVKTTLFLPEGLHNHGKQHILSIPDEDRALM
jgi:hypothetical protein